MMTTNRMKTIAVLCSLVFGSCASAQIPDKLTDGWHAWTAPAVDESDPICCYAWEEDDPKAGPCPIEESYSGWTKSQALPPSDLVVYVKIQNGKAAKIQSYSESCPVERPASLTQHVDVTSDDSVRWLAEQIGGKRKIRTQALASIAYHEGRRADQVLKDLAQSHNSFRTRKDAIFWLGQTRARQQQDVIMKLMFQDDNAKIRQHAAFSWSQSDVENRDEALIRQGQNDKSGQVRAQAWFWLAQTRFDSSEKALAKAIRQDPSRHVRDQAVFALSQLPEERALAALATVVEDESFSVGARKKAVFWLAQMDSDEAFAYLDKLLF